MVRKRLILLSILVIFISGIQGAQARPKAKANELANYTVIHAIPSGFGADVVDVYANGKLIIDNATPGASKSFTVPRGNVLVRIYANGVIPGDTTTALLSAPATYLSSESDYSYVAHLTADEKPALSRFKNMTTEAGSKRSWLTVRHVAGAPAVQLRLNSSPLFAPISNGVERKKSFNLGTYSFDAVTRETSTAVIAPYSITLEKKKNVVLYIWGAKSKGSFAIFKQETMTRKDD